MQRGSALVWLLLGLLIASSLVAVYFYLPKPQLVLESPRNVVVPNILQTYSNNTLGFKFDYPKNLLVKEDTEDGFNQRGHGNFRKNFTGYVQYEPGKFLNGVVVLDQSGSYNTNPFTVWIFDNPQDLSIDAWYNNYWYYPFVWGDYTYIGKFTLAPKVEATVSGQMTKSGVIDYQPGKPKFIYLARDKKMYLLRIISETGDKILSTFKFLK